MNNEQLIKRIEALEEFVQDMSFSFRIPRAVDQAFRERFASLAEKELLDSSVNPNTKEQVHETVSFPQVFNGFKTTVDGILIPYYTP